MNKDNYSTRQPGNQAPHELEALSECHGDRLDDLDRDLWELFAQTAARYPEREAVVSLWQRNITPPKDTDMERVRAHPPYESTDQPPSLRWTYSELLRRSESLASWLQVRGCIPGMRLVAAVWNSAEWALLFWTAVRAGMVFVPLDPRLATADAQFFLEITEPAVVAVQDSDTEQALHKSAEATLTKVSIRISSSPSPTEGWEPLPLFDGGDVPTAACVPNSGYAPDRAADLGVSPGDRVSLIVFTSGTTSRPKGCMHTARNLWAQVHNYDYDESRTERWLVHTPVSHIFAVNNCLRAWQNGDAVVFPSRVFDVQATLRGLVEEKCTFMSAIPALIKAIIAQPTFPGRDKIHLSFVTLGSTLISEADISLCRDQLGSCYAIQAFGMSEGAPVVSWTRSDPLLENGYHAGVGRALPGANIRVCKPGDRQPLPRDQLGELHIGGPAVISSYLGDTEHEAFYHDYVGNWLVTGDQALIDSDGVLHILGRYKDIIIRAGENIAPVKIETALAEIAGVAAQVIGVEDSIAGQVPVAIVNMPDTCTKAEISNKAFTLGPMYALDHVYTLAELGLEQFPLTTTGKVRKDVLRAKVKTFYEERCSPKQAPLPVSPSLNGLSQDTEMTDGHSAIVGREPDAVETTNSSDTAACEHEAAFGKNGKTERSGHLDLTKDLIDVWEDLVGTRPEVDDPIYTFADSITLLRYCDRVLSTLGQRLYLQDFSDNPTVEGLAALVNERAASSKQLHTPGAATQSPFSHVQAPGFMFSGSTLDFSRQTRVTVSAMPTTESFDLLRLPETIEAAAQALQELGLGREYAEDVLPMKDYFRHMVLRQRPVSYVHRVCLGIVIATDPIKVRQTVETALAGRSILRSVLAHLPNGTPFHVVCRPQPRFFDRIIQFRVVEHPQDAKAAMSDGSYSHSSRIMTHVQIITVRSTGEVHLVLTYNHSVFDMMSIIPFHSDLDRLVSSPDPLKVVLPPATPFKLFADLYNMYRDSVPAHESVDYNVQRLRGLSKFTAALFPQQRAPGWMIGTDAGSPVASERAVKRSEIWAEADIVWDESAASTWLFPRQSRIINLHDMPTIRKESGIDPRILVKCGLAVFNARQTGQRYALFNTVEAGRSWPFIPSWMESLLPHPMTIDGPTVEWVLNMVEVNMSSGARGTTVQQLIRHVQQEQYDLEKHCHAPWSKVLAGLGRTEAAVAIDAASRQTFVWDATVRLMGQSMGDFQTLKIEGRYDWADCGLYWNCCMLDSTNLMIIASWDTAQLNAVEANQYLDGFADAVRKVASKQNWERSLADVFGPQ